MSSTANERWRRPIYVVSLVLCAAVGLLILAPRPESFAGVIDTSPLPTVNASLNGLASILLTCGFIAVRTGRIEVHRRFMLTDFATSGAFLVSYVVYHLFSPGPARYYGDFKVIYLIILATPVALARIILPLALTTLSRGLAGVFPQHEKIARPTLAIWLYVSLTGVLIYWMVHT